MSIPVTQINYLSISADTKIEDQTSKAGQQWEKILDLFEHSNGFRRLYWGRSPEDESKIQLHVVKDHFSQHQDFEKTKEHAQIRSILDSLIIASSKPFTRHAEIKEWTKDPQALGKGAPFTGTAIYLETDEAWHVGAWPLWTHVVRSVKGCLGVTGGRLLESVAGHDNCYLVYVGWDSIESHNEYHHTKHYASRRVILALGNQGWVEYGHVKFQGAREAKNRVEKQTARSSRTAKI